MEFKVYDQTIHYSAGIIDYAKYYSEFEEKKNKALKHFMSRMSNNSVTVDQVRNYLEEETKKVVGDLTKKGIYDCTYSDLEKANDAFQRLDQVQEHLNSYVSTVEQYAESQKAELYEEAANDAAASVQGGPSFGIFTSSIPAAVAYSVAGSMDADRQLNKAKRKFQESVNNINFETDSTKRSLISKFKSNVLNKDLLTIILDFYKILFTTYIFMLEENNKLEPVVQSLSEKRAYEMLESIDYVEDQKKLITKSLELYPFEYYLYYKVFQLSLYNADLTNILETLGVQNAIIENFKNSKYFQVPTKYYNIEKYVEISQKQNAFISLVSGVDQETILKDELSYYANNLIYKYENVLNDIKKLVDEDVFANNKNIEQVKAKNNQLYQNKIIHIDEKNEGDLLKKKYGIDIYSIIFNEKEDWVITNREEALLYMKNMLDTRILKYWLKKEEVEKEENERRKERKEKRDKKLQPVLKVVRPIHSFAKKHTVILIVILVILIVGINAIVAQANSNKDVHENRKLDNNYTDKNRNSVKNENRDGFWYVEYDENNTGITLKDNQILIAPENDNDDYYCITLQDVDFSGYDMNKHKKAYFYVTIADTHNNKWLGEQEVIPTSEEMKNITIRVKVSNDDGEMNTFDPKRVDVISIVAYSDN